MSDSTSPFNIHLPQDTDKVAKLAADIRQVSATTNTALVNEQARVDGAQARVEAKVDSTNETVLLVQKLALKQAIDAKYGYAAIHKAGNVSYGVRHDGVPEFEIAPKLPSGAIPVEALGKSVGLRQVAGASGWSGGMCNRDGKVIYGLRKDGTFYSAVDGSGAPQVSSRARVAASGDSTTAGGSLGSLWPDRDTTAWPARLMAALPGVTVFNLGTSGAPSDEINIRSGAKKLYLHGTIPVSGPTTLTTKQNIAWYPGRAASIPCVIAGVPGTLAASSAGLVFTRDGAGAAVTVNGQALVSIWDTHSGDTLIVMMGRNDINPGLTGNYDTVADHVVANYVEAVNYLTPHYKSFVVVGPVPETDETTGTPNHNIVLEIAARLKALWPANTESLHRYLVDHAMADMGLTPTTADTTAIAGDTLPPSIMDDNTHYSRATCQVIGENFFAPILTTKGLV